MSTMEEAGLGLSLTLVLGDTEQVLHIPEAQLHPWEGRARTIEEECEI